MLSFYGSFSEENWGKIFKEDVATRIISCYCEIAFQKQLQQ